MTTNNAINLKLSGVATYDGSGAFTASNVTQYNSLVGAASNAFTSVAPGSTAGVPFCSNGSSSDPSYKTLPIAGGGSNATTYTSSNGIITYNGTSLVNYTGTSISSTGVYTNTNQPAFFAYLNTTINNVTGDGSLVTVVFDTAPVNRGTCYNTSNGIFTAPKTGTYQFNSSLTLTGLSALFTSYFSSFNQDGFFWYTNDANTAVLRHTTTYCTNTSMTLQLTAGQTVKVYPAVSGSGKTVGYGGVSGSTIRSFFSGYLLS